MSKQDKKLMRRIYLTEFFSESLAVYALIPLLFEQYGQVSVSKVGLLLATWQIATVIFEIPTGLVADRFGRKISMQLGKVARIICFPLWLLVPSFAGLFVGTLFLALGDALLSGSLEAYTYDKLVNKSTYNKFRQQTVAVHLAAFSAAGLYAFILRANYVSMLFISVISATIGFIFSFYLPEDIIYKAEKITLRRILRDASYEIQKHRTVLKRFIQASLAMTLLVFFIEQITLFYSDTGVSAQTVALLMAIGNILTFLLLWSLHLFEQWSRKYQIWLLFWCFVALGLTISSQNEWLQITSIFLAVRVIRIIFLHTTNDLQHAISSRARATVGSLSSFIGKIIASAGIVSVGIFSVHSSDSRLPIFIIGSCLVTLYILIDRFWKSTYERQT